MFGLFKRRMEVEEESDDVSHKDLEAAVFIQQKAQVGEMFAKRLSDPEEDYETQRRHYESVRDDLLGWLDTIEDEFSRSFAAHQLIDMCIVGNDEPVARALLAGVRDEFIREKIFEGSPALKVKKITTG